MVQRRMVYASLWQNEDFAKLSDKEKILYVGLITLADDYGRLKVNLPALRSQIFLYDEDLKSSDLLIYLQNIANNGLIYLYENNQYIEHPNWFKYQMLRKDRLSRSLCPQYGNQLTTTWQPTDGHSVAEVSKQVIEVSNIDRKIPQSVKDTIKKTLKK